jgi:purine nucleoside phosphorylase
MSDEQQKALIRQIAWEVAEQIEKRQERRAKESEKRIREYVEHSIKLHAASCPMANRMAKMSAVGAALLVVANAAGWIGGWVLRWIMHNSS